MKRLLTILLLFPVIASAQTWQESSETVADWLALEMEYAASKAPVKVEMPLVVRSTGWGCRCPEHYIGVGTTVQEGPFLSLENVPKNFPISDATGHSLIVTGYFTGKYKTLDLRAKEDEPEEWNYKLPVFVIESWKANTLGDDVPAPHVVQKKH